MLEKNYELAKLQNSFLANRKLFFRKVKWNVFQLFNFIPTYRINTILTLPSSKTNAALKRNRYFFVGKQGRMSANFFSFLKKEM